MKPSDITTNTSSLTQGGQVTVPHHLSLVIPMYNEEDNVAPMLTGVHEALADYQYPWELILVNDGSADDTERRMREGALRYGSHVRIISLQRNFGQTAAMQAGIDAARGEVIATLDGDLQNDPTDIPRMVKRLLEEDLDLLVGWRKSRKDNFWMRTLPSLIANRLIGRITGVRLHDYGCSLKVYRAEVIRSVRLYGEMHRFIPAWVATATLTSRIKEEVVGHHARSFGTSKYGISRTFRVIFDLLSVYFFSRFRARPGHYFGMIGLVFGLLGASALGYLFIIKVFFGEDIGTRPMLFIGILFVVVAVQFLTTGVLSELLARTYFESGNSYIVRHAEAQKSLPEASWKQPG
ncbi:MAG TPA: glycosyltransferase family 2 protein [Gammaproteobacteria bacterium]|nr:glycosyltransferase family 2 protein [Gammaproteobacteria bacterium]